MKEHNVHIQFNASIIKRMKELDLSVDYIGSILFILFALLEGRYDLLDEFDDGNRERRAIILYRQMERRGLLEADMQGVGHYKLTMKAVELIEFVTSEFEKENKSITAALIEPVAEEEDVMEWIKDYVNLFPAGRFFGRQLRLNHKDAARRMQDFQKKYKYDKDTILGATKMYIREQEQSPTGHEYTRNSNYFIFKGVGKDLVSDLATWCENYLKDKEGVDKKLDTGFMDIM